MGVKLWKVYCGAMKVYFWLMAVLSALAVIGAFVLKQPWWNLLGLFSNIAQTVAIYGFCFSKKILRNIFWKFAFPLFVLDELAGKLTHELPGPLAYQVFYYLFFVGPIFMGLWLYAFKRNDIWGEEASPK